MELGDFIYDLKVRKHYEVVSIGLTEKDLPIEFLEGEYFIGKLLDTDKNVNQVFRVDQKGIAWQYKD